MSFELSEMILGCGLERGGRRAVLEAMAHFADRDTGMVRVSQARLAQRAGLTERQVRRVRDSLLYDDELEGLLRCVRHASGRGNAAVYRLDVTRLEPLRSAMVLSARRIYAGAAKAQLDNGLAGVKATPGNIRSVFAALIRQLADEDQNSTRRAVEALRDEFESAMASHHELSVIGRRLEDGAGELDGAVDGAAKAGHNVHLSGDENPDIMSRKADILSKPHSMDISPSGKSTPAASPAACGKILVGSAVGFDRFLFEVEGLLAHATLNRRERMDLIHDLQGRVARVTLDGILAIRARNEADAEAMAARWLEPLLGWAGDVGLAGVVFDGGAE
ncbi:MULTISPECIES: hypothetical protein [Hyphomonas]|nr:MULTISPECIES: hypothetical protein [Hyphomonas]MBB40971.1 hypothetical protein [Hyphomonas sp.]